MQLLDAEQRKPDDKKTEKLLLTIIAIFSIVNPILIALLDSYTLVETLFLILGYTFFGRLFFLIFFIFLALFRVIWVIISDAVGLTETSDSKLERDQSMMVLYFLVICDSLFFLLLIYFAGVNLFGA